LKLSQTPGRLVPGVMVAVACMAASGALLWLAQRNIPIGTAYAVWTGIGAAGTFLVGVLFYGDPAGALRLVSVGLIVAGIVGLKLAHGSG
jgi:quaternary ammonium compound-resistance protein SugE